MRRDHSERVQDMSCDTNPCGKGGFDLSGLKLLSCVVVGCLTMLYSIYGTVLNRLSMVRAVLLKLDQHHLNIHQGVKYNDGYSVDILC